MSKKLQCQECGRAEYGEDLYNYDGELLCRYCIVARVYEGSTPCEYVGTCNDKTFLNKADQIDQLKQQLAEKDKEIDYWKDKTRNKILNMKATDFMKMCLGCGLVLDITEQQVPLAVRELEKVKNFVKNANSIIGLDWRIDRFKVIEIIDNQIKVLKGK